MTTNPEAGMRLVSVELITRAIGFIVHDDDCNVNCAPGHGYCNCGASSVMQELRHLAAAPVAPAVSEGETVWVVYGDDHDFDAMSQWLIGVYWSEAEAEAAGQADAVRYKREGGSSDRHNYEITPTLLAARAQPPVGSATRTLRFERDRLDLETLEVKPHTVEIVGTHPAEPAARDGGEADPAAVANAIVDELTLQNPDCQRIDEHTIWLSGGCTPQSSGTNLNITSLINAVLSALAASGEK